MVTVPAKQKVQTHARDLLGFYVELSFSVQYLPVARLNTWFWPCTCNLLHTKIHFKNNCPLLVQYVVGFFCKIYNLVRQYYTIYKLQ